MNKLLLILFASTGVLALTSLHLVRELRGERQLSEQLQTRVAELERRPAPASQTPFAPVRAQERPSSLSGPQAAVPQPERPRQLQQAAAVPAMPSPEERMRMFRESHERRRALLSDPTYRTAMRNQHRYMLQRSYPDLEEALGLTKEEAGRLLDVIADQQIRMQENSPPPYDGNDPQAARAMAERYQEQVRANEAELAGVLGPHRMQEWKDYQASLGMRHNLNNMRAQFASKGAPLDEQQSKSVLKALVAQQQRQMEEMRRAATNAGAAGGPHNAIVSSSPGSFGLVFSSAGMPAPQNHEERLRQYADQLERTRDSLEGVLSSQQLRILEQEHEEQIEMQRVQIEMMQAELEAQQRSGMGSDPANATRLEAVSPVFAR